MVKYDSLRVTAILSSPDSEPRANQSNFVIPDAIHLTGPGLAELNHERYEILERLIGDFGLQAVMVVNEGEDRKVVNVPDDPSRVEFAESELPPVPVGYDDFLHFAKRNGYRNDQAWAAWRRACDVWQLDHEGKFWDYEPYPHIQAQGTVDEHGRLDYDDVVFDLRSIRERLIALPDPQCWQHTGRVYTQKPLAYFRDFANRRFPDEPPIETDYSRPVIPRKAP